MCQTNGIPPVLSKASDLTNELTLNSLFNYCQKRIEGIKNPKIGYFGISYKEGSWLLEDSQQLQLAIMLNKKGKVDVIFDPLSSYIQSQYDSHETLTTLLEKLTSNLDVLMQDDFDFYIFSSPQPEEVHSALEQFATAHNIQQIYLYERPLLETRFNTSSEQTVYDGNQLTTEKIGQNKLTISAEIFNHLLSWFETICNSRLPDLHNNLHPNEYEHLASKYTDQRSHFHDLIHQAYDEDSHFVDLYLELIYFTLKNNYPFLISDSVAVQAFPTIRIQFPDNIPVFEFHKDRYYNHPEEVNNFLALTDCFDTAVFKGRLHINKERRLRVFLQ